MCLRVCEIRLLEYCLVHLWRVRRWFVKLCLPLHLISPTSVLPSFKLCLCAPTLLNPVPEGQEFYYTFFAFETLWWHWRQEFVRYCVAPSVTPGEKETVYQQLWRLRLRRAAGHSIFCWTRQDVHAVKKKKWSKVSLTLLLFCLRLQVNIMCGCACWIGSRMTVRHQEVEEEKLI